MLPLCASVMYPPFDRATTGCAFSIVDDPDVLYRVWPTADTPGNLASSLPRLSDSVPIFLTARAFPAGSIDTTPTDSCPRCCNEYRPKLREVRRVDVAVYSGISRT